MSDIKACPNCGQREAIGCCSWKASRLPVFDSIEPLFMDSQDNEMTSLRAKLAQAEKARDDATALYEHVCNEKAALAVSLGGEGLARLRAELEAVKAERDALAAGAPSAKLQADILHLALECEHATATRDRYRIALEAIKYDTDGSGIMAGIHAIAAAALEGTTKP